MNLTCMCGIGLVAATMVVGMAQAADSPGPSLSGDQILSRAASADTLRSYSVPVHFDVRLHRPISARAGVEGIAYYKAPAQAVLVITKMPSIIDRFFKGSYNLDMVPQTWPAKYSVQSVSEDRVDGASVYVLQAVPKANADIDHVVFNVTEADYLPVSAVWYYRNKSSIRLSIVNQRVSNYTLPQTESITVNMSQYGLDAAGRYGEYAVNTAVPDAVFNAK